MKKLFLIITFLAFVLRSTAQTLSEKLHQYMLALSEHSNFNGSVLVAKEGNILLEKGYGLRSAASQIKHDANSIFQIGSVTKQFTSAIMLKLQQEGKLSIKDKLSKYFPQYVHADKISIGHLLNHVSGIYNYTNDDNFMQKRITEHLSHAAFWNLIKDKPLDFEPGSKFNYSNSGYVILGYVIEKVTGQPYESVARKYLFQPANMTHSGYDFTHLQSPLKSVGYLNLTKEIQLAAPIVDSSVAFSAGAIYSTVHDLYNWNTTLNSGKIIPLQVLETAYKPYKSGYGFGLNIDSVSGKRHISHGGGIHGFVSMLSYIPQDKVSVAIIANAPFSLGRVEKDVLAILYNQPYKVAEAPKEIKVDSSGLTQYVGEYELAPTFKITITLANGRLKAQATGQQAFEIYPKEKNIFFYKTGGFFTKNN